MTSPATSAIEKVKSMQLLPLDAPILKAPDSSVYGFADLPLKVIDPMASKKHPYTSIIEVLDLPDTPDLDVIHQRLTSSDATSDEPWAFLDKLPSHHFVWALNLQNHHDDGHTGRMMTQSGVTELIMNCDLVLPDAAKEGARSLS
eukprot:4899634-Amphidinium_carterae.1